MSNLEWRVEQGARMGVHGRLLFVQCSDGVMGSTPHATGSR